jgi:hypothetical protein
VSTQIQTTSKPRPRPEPAARPYQHDRRGPGAARRPHRQHKLTGNPAEPMTGVYPPSALGTTRPDHEDPAQPAATDVAAQPGPAAPAAAARPARRLRARFRNASERELWGYGVWLSVGLVFGVPESWAGITSPPWPALSDTIGHLEQLWHPVRVIVVTLIVFAAFHAVRYPPGRAGEFAAPESKTTRCRTPCGRFARSGTGAAGAVPVMVYFPLAIGVVAGGSILAAIAGGGMFVLGDVIYGLIAVFLVLIPNALAFWLAADVPFPTLYRTIANLEHRWRPAAMIIVAGLVVLAFHLVFFPWPDIFLRG